LAFENELKKNKKDAGNCETPEVDVQSILQCELNKQFENRPEESQASIVCCANNNITETSMEFFIIFSQLNRK
jgi:hypothetical protein